MLQKISLAVLHFGKSSKVIDVQLKCGFSDLCFDSTKWKQLKLVRYCDGVVHAVM